MVSERGVMRAGAIAAWLAAALTLIWLAALLTLPTMPENAPLEEELLFIAENETAYMILYGGVFLLALVQLPLFLALTALNYRRWGGSAWVWGTAGVLYVAFSLPAYWSQLTVVRGLTDLFVNAEDVALQTSALTAYLTWSYSGRLAAYPYALDFLGYFLYSLALLGFGVMLVRERGVDLVSGGLLILAALSGLTGVIGYLARAALLEDGVVMSGAFLMPAFFTLAYRFWREARLE
jgi:hypothetical protein